MSTPIASGIVKISVNVMAASNGNLLKGCKVNSLQTSGFFIISKKSGNFVLTSMYSGKYLPAWRSNHTGTFNALFS